MSTPDPLWDEPDMADLVGLQLPDAADTDTEDAAHPVSPTDSLPASGPLLDPEDLDEQAVAGRHRLSLATNPFTKLGIVAAGTGLVIGVLGVFTHNVMQNNPSQTAQEVDAERAEPRVEAEDSLTPDDRGQLLTDLALGQQQAELKALAEDHPTVPATAPPTENPPAGEAPTQPVSPSPQPQPVVSRSVPTPAPPRPTLTPIVPPMVQSNLPQPQPEPDPIEQQEQWLALSQVGSYGQGVPPRSTQPSDSVPVAQSTEWEQAATPPSHPAINAAEEAAILQGQPLPSSSRTLTTGTQATAELTTPLIWTAAMATERPQVVVELTEPLLTAEETIVLPADTPLVVQVDAVEESGFVQLQVVSFIQDGQEMALPAAAMQLRGPDGTPLVAQPYSESSPDLVETLLSRAAISGLARAAELINRPQSSTVIYAAGSRTISQESGDPNLWAGVLEGALDPLMEQLAAQSDPRPENPLDRFPIWYLPAGTDVDVYIQQTVTL
ncbi:MAG: TrbI/VirB10 family protein [Thainema sp.]